MVLALHAGQRVHNVSVRTLTLRSVHESILMRWSRRTAYA